MLLSGLGSDELLGGYGRHRHAFAKGGWEGLLDEVSRKLNFIQPTVMLTTTIFTIAPAGFGPPPEPESRSRRPGDLC